MTERQYSEKDLERIAAIMYDIAATASCTVYDGRGLPICRQWPDLSTSEKESSVNGLRQRVQRETLPGYFERKRREVPAASQIYERTIQRLKELGLL